MSTDRYYAVALAITLALAGGPLRGQAPATAPTTAPATSPATEPAATWQGVYPQVQQGQIRIPAAFWDQQLVGWLEVAISGRPSDFLHETLISVATTRTELLRALGQIGCHNADAWVDRAEDFPQVRGDRLWITLEVLQQGQLQRYAMEELIGIMDWHCGIGPMGWFFKGTPGTALPTGPAANKPLSLSDVVRDDPQASLRLEGIQHQSQSIIDSPMSYLPAFPVALPRLERLDRWLSRAVFSSNGQVPVTLVIQKVSEREFLEKSAEIWHDRPQAKSLLQALPLADQIDALKARLWQVRQPRQGGQRQGGSNASEALLIAQIAGGYRELDRRWISESLAGARIDAQATTESGESLQEQASGLKAQIEEACQLAQAQIQVRLAEQELQGISPESPGYSQARGRYLGAQSRELLLENQPKLLYWKNQAGKLSEEDSPWHRHVGVQRQLAEARDTLARCGCAYAQAMESPDASGLQTAKAAYTQAVKAATLAALRLEETQVKFALSSQEGAEAAALQAQLSQIQRQIQNLSPQAPETSPAAYP